MLMDCVPGDVLLKKSQHSSCKTIILASNIVAKNCDFQVNNSFFLLFICFFFLKEGYCNVTTMCKFCSYKQDSIQMCLLLLLPTPPVSLPTTQRHFDWAE